MRVEALVIDADGHILEPPDLWETYLEPKYRPKAIRIRVGDDGYEYLEVAGKRSAMTRAGALGMLGGMGKQLEIEEARRRREEFITAGKAEQLRFRKPMPEDTYLKGAAFGTMDMRERIQLLDREGMAKAILYSTIGLLWECETLDPELSGAYCRAYNRWIADFCRDSGGRLIPIAHLSLGDPDEAARELERAAKDGCKGAFVAPFTITRAPMATSRTIGSSRRRRIADCPWQFIRQLSRRPGECSIAMTTLDGRRGTSACSPVMACSMPSPRFSSWACSIVFRH